MKFEEYDFSLLNESDIREEIIAPLLRYLGYRSGTTVNIIREQSLRYPKVFLGRKDTKKDPELRGRADYICEVDKSIRWIIEAKPPQVDISLNDVEQAYTYANHPEIRAIFFCLINGHRLRIYQTNQGPNVPAILEIAYEELNENLLILQNILGADALRRDHPAVKPDTGEPIGKGLRSIVRVTTGSITFASSNAGLSILNELTFAISGGSIERDENQCLTAYLKTQTPFRSMNEMNTKLGLDRLELFSIATELSDNSLKPTLFTESTTTTLAAGETIFDPYAWRAWTLPQNVTYRTETQAKGILTEQKFHGDFQLKYQLLNPHQVIDMQGKFEIYLA